MNMPRWRLRVGGTAMPPSAWAFFRQTMVIIKLIISVARSSDCQAYPPFTLSGARHGGGDAGQSGWRVRSCWRDRRAETVPTFSAPPGL
jgi:hypothetical protein